MFTYADLDYALTLYPPLRNPPPIIARLIQIENEYVSASNSQEMKQSEITVRVLKAIWPDIRNTPPIIARLIQIDNEHTFASNRQAMEQSDITVRVLKAICPNKGNNVSSLKKALLKLYDVEKMSKSKPGYDESLTKVLTHIHNTLSSRGALAHSDLGDKQKNKPRSCLLCCWPKSGQQLLDEDAKQENRTTGYRP
jgi:hypothetical protein